MTGLNSLHFLETQVQREKNEEDNKNDKTKLNFIIQFKNLKFMIFVYACWIRCCLHYVA